MPHAYKAHPDHPAVDYLVRLHADLGGQVQANKIEAKRLVEALRHVEAVIKLFDPAYNIGRSPPDAGTRSIHGPSAAPWVAPSWK